MVGLGFLPGGLIPISLGWGVSRDGVIAVTPSYSACSVESYQPAIWTEAGGMQGLGMLPGVRTCMGFTFGISPDGATVAGWIRGSFASGTPGTRAYRWTEATGMVDLGRLATSSGENGGVSERGEVIVGDALTADDPVFIWDAAGGLRSLKVELQTKHGLDLSGVTLKYAQAISADGRKILIETSVGQRIVYLGDGRCYPDCDGDGELTFFDFLCFQNLFAAGDPGADCDGDGSLTFFDFLCFQNEFAAGCP